MFADRAQIYIRSGKGGDGHVSFRREKFVPDGGPDGGDGGNGGDVIIKVDPGMNTLSDYRHIRKYKAEDGEEGGKKNCKGKSGADIVLKVPKGTVIKELNSMKVIVDMSGDIEEYTILKGGHGGNGNQHYATPTMQAPKYAQPGQPAKELDLYMELKVIADVGLIGFPNVGKSTLLTKCSNARPEIANYHFTTLSPHLGVVDIDNAGGFVMADIPGIIEGASEGVGLGFDFLRHIERTKVFVHVVDASGSEGRNPLEDIETIHNELRKYNDKLMERPIIIAANKIDIISDEPVDIDDNGNFIYSQESKYVQMIKDKFEPMGFKVFPISSYTESGVKELILYVSEVLSKLDKTPVTFEQEFDPLFFFPDSNEPFTVSYDNEFNEYVVEGPRIEKMLGYTNLESEKGFAFFQKFLKDNGILDELEKLGINEGDTVRLYDLTFDYYN